MAFDPGPFVRKIDTDFRGVFRCVKCQRYKPRFAFADQPGRSTGRHSYCRVCDLRRKPASPWTHLYAFRLLWHNQYPLIKIGATQDWEDRWDRHCRSYFNDGEVVGVWTGDNLREIDITQWFRPYRLAIANEWFYEYGPVAEWASLVPPDGNYLEVARLAESCLWSSVLEGSNE